MKILFDQGTPVPLRRFLHPHHVDTVSERGWSTLQNGTLLQMAESNKYDVFVTTDRNLKYQQNLSNRTIRIVVLSTTSWPKITPKAGVVLTEIDRLPIGGFTEITIV
jgi:hypothetical protein